MLSDLISDKIGEAWPSHLDQLAQLKQFAEDPKFQREFMEVKSQNKRKLAAYLTEKTGVEVNPASIFDIQVKRIHEYKRQLLNILHIITMYNRIKANPKDKNIGKLCHYNCMKISGGSVSEFLWFGFDFADWLRVRV